MSDFDSIKKKHKTLIEVYTDGSFKKTPNGDICGYGIYFPDHELPNVSAPFTYGKMTNNRAELYAILQAIIKIVKNYIFDLIIIYTDSEYSQKSLTTYINEWRKNNWKKSNNKPVENQDIIKKIDKYLQKLKGKINIQWVRAHTKGGDIYSINNAKADILANKGAEKMRKNNI